ncbi:hypothetical protein K9N68_05950 [Kovacikia minuta CCNUW1]|uniref:hypothetical protein n=1 Tax=Kovacikia minuta TaxID=2931930 RepID=UPI001CCEFF3B|nr:hypothetical protein [Kovacikia minuta]UBF27486.1 hypothetical protein K9N68_05950 [Kovacikia minuta CCNUW1]
MHRTHHSTCIQQRVEATTIIILSSLFGLALYLNHVITQKSDFNDRRILLPQSAHPAIQVSIKSLTIVG